MAGSFNDFNDRVVSAFNGKIVTFSDTVEFKMTRPASSVVDANRDVYCSAFHVSDNGNLAVQWPGESTTHTLYVNKGTTYNYSIGKFMSTGTDAALKVAGIIVALA